MAHGYHPGSLKLHQTERGRIKKLIEFAEWTFTPGRPSCEECEKRFEKLVKKPLPCLSGECPYGKPELLSVNHYAWELYLTLSGQVIIAGMGEPLGINYLAIQFIFDLYEITDSETRQLLFEKIRAIDDVRCKERSQQIRKQLESAKSKPRK